MALAETRAAQRDMLRSERRRRHELEAAVLLGLAIGRGTHEALQTAALRFALRRAIAQGALRSWLAGADAAGRDVAWLARVSGVTVEHYIPPGPAGIEALSDGPASRYANAIRKMARDGDITAQQAARANGWRLDRIAVTENSINFNAGRVETIEASAERADLYRRTGLKLTLYWDAQLDACEHCGMLDGKPESEWLGESPGAVHVNCRCVSHIALE
jgi:hypothetical protein